MSVNIIARPAGADPPRLRRCRLALDEHEQRDCEHSDRKHDLQRTPGQIALRRPRIRHPPAIRARRDIEPPDKGTANTDPPLPVKPSARPTGKPKIIAMMPIMQDDTLYMLRIRETATRHQPAFPRVTRGRLRSTR